MKPITAAFIFFTRLPLWRLKACDVAPGHFRDAINFWSLTGWLTAIVMAGVLWLSAQVLPYAVAVVLAILSRILLTGALHEDGLADFLDGFGGGTDRDKTLAIMKDSHIGTYGVIGLLFYFLLLALLLFHLSLPAACIAVLVADPFCKLVSSQIIRFLPYARTEESSKSKVIYRKPAPVVFLISCLSGLFPLVLIPDIRWLTALICPLLLFVMLIRIMKKKIGGYTGDCCGALFLLCELSFYIGLVICANYFPV